MSSQNETIGQRLRARRISLGLTLAQVAKLAGLSLPYVSNLERGRANPTMEALQAVSKALDMPLAQIVGEGVDDATLRQSIVASAPASLRNFSRSQEFKEAVRELALAQGETEDSMRQRLLLGMAASPQRGTGDPTEADWRRILDAYSLILKRA